jgi:predicted CopG family antitoxin
MKSLHLLIDDDLYDKLKSAAASRSESVAEVVRKTLREWVDKPILAGRAPSLTVADLHEILRVMDAQDFPDAPKKETDA